EMAGFAHPLVEIAMNRPSGEGTRFIGKPPTNTCRPSGEMRHPFGSSVTPLPSYPGLAGGAASRCASVGSVAANTTAPKLKRKPDVRMQLTVPGRSYI